MERFVVTPFKPIAFLRRSNQPPDIREKQSDFFSSEFTLSDKQFVHPDDQLGQGMEPRKPGIVQDELQQLPR